MIQYIKHRSAVFSNAVLVGYDAQLAGWTSNAMLLASDAPLLLPIWAKDIAPGSVSKGKDNIPFSSIPNLADLPSCLQRSEQVTGSLILNSDRSPERLAGVYNSNPAEKGTPPTPVDFIYALWLNHRIGLRTTSLGQLARSSIASVDMVTSASSDRRYAKPPAGADFPTFFDPLFEHLGSLFSCWIGSDVPMSDNFNPQSWVPVSWAALPARGLGPSLEGSLPTMFADETPALLQLSRGGATGPKAVRTVESSLLWWAFYSSLDRMADARTLLDRVDSHLDTSSPAFMNKKPLVEVYRRLLALSAAECWALVPHVFKAKALSRLLAFPDLRAGLERDVPAHLIKEIDEAIAFADRLPLPRMFSDLLALNSLSHETDATTGNEIASFGLPIHWLQALREVEWLGTGKKSTGDFLGGRALVGGTAPLQTGVSAPPCSSYIAHGVLATLLGNSSSAIRTSSFGAAVVDLVCLRRLMLAPGGQLPSGDALDSREAMYVSLGEQLGWVTSTVDPMSSRLFSAGGASAPLVVALQSASRPLKSVHDLVQSAKVCESESVVLKVEEVPLTQPILASVSMLDPGAKASSLFATTGVFKVPLLIPCRSIAMDVSPSGVVATQDPVGTRLALGLDPINTFYDDAFFPNQIASLAFILSTSVAALKAEITATPDRFTHLGDLDPSGSWKPRQGTQFLWVPGRESMDESPATKVVLFFPARTSFPTLSIRLGRLMGAATTDSVYVVRSSLNGPNPADDSIAAAIDATLAIVTTPQEDWDDLFRR